ncbi:MAG: hypothetical protein AAB608_02880 [Patescibacteria group bacterium]
MEDLEQREELIDEARRAQALARAVAESQNTQEGVGEEVGESEEKKMGLISFLFGLTFLAIPADAAEFFTGGTLGWFVGLCADILLYVLFSVTSASKSQMRRFLIAAGIEKIPTLPSALPIRSIVLIWTYLSSRTIVQKAVSRVVDGASAVAPALQIPAVRSAAERTVKEVGITVPTQQQKKQSP